MTRIDNRWVIQLHTWRIYDIEQFQLFLLSMHILFLRVSREYIQRSWGEKLCCFILDSIRKMAALLQSFKFLTVEIWFCSVANWDRLFATPMHGSTPGFSVYHCLPGFAQTYVHWVSDATSPYHPLSPPFPPALNLFQHQGLFQWVSSLHQVAEVLKLQHQSIQWIFRVDFL